MDFASWEQVLVVLLAVASGAVFGRDLARQVRHVTAGKPDRDRTDRLGRRLWVTFKEVIFQTRVIGGRPVVGTLHALVFLGFLTFGFETTDHFLEPFHIPFLVPLFGALLPAFRVVLMVTAVLVAVSIAGLAYRRFFMKESSPDPESYSSGVVAALIFLLMLTYINGVLAEPLFEQANWWAHTLIILIFPHLILRSKHFHILMAPVDIFYRTHRLGDLLPLNLDLEAMEESEEEVSLGLETMADAPWKMRMDFLTCVECRRCTEQCPAATCDQELNPRGFILAGRAALGQDEAPVIGSVISEIALGAVHQLRRLREHLPGRHRAPAAADRRQASPSAGNRQGDGRVGVSRDHRALRQPVLQAEVGSPGADSGSGPADLSTGRDRVPGLARLRLELQRRRPRQPRGDGRDPRGLGRELGRARRGELQRPPFAPPGRGAPVPDARRREHRALPRESGQEGDLALSALPAHHALGVPDARRRLRAGGGSPLRDDLQASRRSRIEVEPTNSDRTLTYHDPCYLGRFEKVYDEPRDVIRATGGKLVELGRHGERSFCCGGGSAGFMREQEVKRRVDVERKEEIAGSGAQTLVTSCPECKMMLNAAVEETKDLAELVADSLKGGSSRTPTPPTS